MERYYTIPMEIGLYPTPGIDNIRSTSFYGLTFVRVTFKYGVDFFFAYTQAALSLAQNVSLPGNQVASISQSSLARRDLSLPGGWPPAFRTYQPANCARLDRTSRLVYSYRRCRAGEFMGRTTKQYNVDVDPNKLDAYNVTIPQIISALATPTSMSVAAKSPSASSP